MGLRAMRGLIAYNEVFLKGLVNNSDRFFSLPAQFFVLAVQKSYWPPPFL